MLWRVAGRQPLGAARMMRKQGRREISLRSFNHQTSQICVYLAMACTVASSIASVWHGGGGGDTTLGHPL